MGWFDRFRALFSRKKTPLVRAPTMNIPAPQTLVAKVEKLEDVDRDMLRVAEEALRRGFPEQAHAAYWKAIRLYVGDAQHLKAISVINSVLKIRPDDTAAMIAKGDACLALDRRRDAALAYLEASAIFEQRGENQHALELLERCIDLDKRIEGLKLRYTRLGGERDVWTKDLPRLPDEQVPPPAISDAFADLPQMPLADQVPVPAPRPKTQTPQPRLPTRTPAPAPQERPASIVRGLPNTPPPAQVAKDAEPIELELSVQMEAVAPPPRVMTRPPVKFNVPQASTVYEPGLPSAIIGTEHEKEASGDVAGEPASGISDAQTTAIDSNELSALLKKVKVS